jgi:hypothetical protein
MSPKGSLRSRSSALKKSHLLFETASLVSLRRRRRRRRRLGLSRDGIFCLAEIHDDIMGILPSYWGAIVICFIDVRLFLNSSFPSFIFTAMFSCFFGLSELDILTS